MLTDGAGGTAAGDGLKQGLAQAGCSDVSKYYKAARIYNSGSIAAGGNLGGGVATHCYSSDIANRLTGWYAGTSKCDPNTIGTMNGSGSSSGGGASGVASATGGAATATLSGGAFAQTSSTSTSTSTSTATVVTVPVASGTGSSGSPYSFGAGFASGTTTAAVPSGTATSSGGAYAEGSKCTSPGSWNCIGGTAFQRCSNNQWSTVMQLSEGTTCTPGEVAAIDIYAAKSSAGVKPRRVRDAREIPTPVPGARAFPVAS
jgi:hypothetical protein